MSVSSPLTLLSVVAVALAGVAFVVTDRPVDEQPARASAPVRSSAPPASTEPSSPATGAPRRPPKKRQVRRGETYVEVFNNSGISGLAGSTAARAAGAGWQVVGSDNWYGTIAASTVYYPERLREHAELLRKDLGVARIKPIIAPMRGDRLTVILTADYV
ncbi:MAG TPA: LytR C-terminal domain-containing protein [Nocardioidaceae bacterium]|nr:LytR C-terminal domain-containing protein [Nocardioidaceae bacterium]